MTDSSDAPVEAPVEVIPEETPSETPETVTPKEEARRLHSQRMKEYWAKRKAAKAARMAKKAESRERVTVKKTPSISVIERRLQSGDAFRVPSQAIPMKDPNLVPRWVNPAIKPDHLWELLHAKGWEYCEPEDLDCNPAEHGAAVRDGRVVMGERGHELILVKMTKQNVERIALAKARQAEQQTFGKTQIKEAIVSRTAQEHGDQAADYVNRTVRDIEVRDSRGPSPE